jgi:uncharacterized protein (DUF362 family)
MNKKKVAILTAEKEGYPSNPPFHPPEGYPEYLYEERDESNTVYKAVRDLLIHLELDKENFGTKHWNPLKELMKPGDSVVIKPNLVFDKHPDGEDIYSMITHPSVIRAIVDYCYIALNGKGCLTIADAPVGNCDFENLLRITKLYSIKEFYEKKAGFTINILDLRKTMYLYNKYGFAECETRTTLDGDPNGYTVIDLGLLSELSSLKEDKTFQGADFNRKETIQHHHKNRHEYLISNTILHADVIISLPKMKVHKKAGVTLNLKNAIGINGDKNYLPHFRLGSPKNGGDEIPDDLPLTLRGKLRLERIAFDYFLSKNNVLLDKILKVMAKIVTTLDKNYMADLTQKICPGDWYFNDTIWRVIVDLNRILVYSDKNGKLLTMPKRRFFSIIDGIIGGEQEGPLKPTPKHCAVLIGGFDPVLVDIVATTLMGFDYKKIPLYKNLLTEDAYKITGFTEEDIEITSNTKEYENMMNTKDKRYFNFKPSRGWKGYC